MRTTVLAAADVREAVPMADAIAAVRSAFLALDRDEFEQPVRTALGDGEVLVMSAFHRPTAAAVVKSVRVDPTRRPTVEGMVLCLAGTGEGAVVADAATVTSLRTGAVVGVATDALASPSASELVLIGLGAQAPDQLRAVRAVRPVEGVTLVSPRASTGDAFRERYATLLSGLQVSISTDATAAVRTADIVCCATPSREPLFPADALPERVHVNAIGAYRLTMRELPARLLGSAFVVVDQREATLAESGEVHHALGAGLLGAEDLVELGSLLARPREHLPLAPRTVFKSVGLAIQDWAIGRALQKWQVNRAEPPGGS